MSFMSIIVAILVIASIVYGMFWFNTTKSKFEDEYSLFLKDKGEEQKKDYDVKIQREFLDRRKFWMRASGVLALVPLFFYPRLALSEGSLIFVGLNYMPLYLFFSYVLNLYIFDARIFSNIEPMNSPKNDLHQIKKLFTSRVEPYIYVCAFILFVYMIAHFGVSSY